VSEQKRADSKKLKPRMADSGVECNNSKNPELNRVLCDR